MLLAVVAVLLSIIGVVLTGLYPGIFVLFLIALIPFSSRLYVNRMVSAGNVPMAALIILNVLAILVMLWMSFVIVHDRVLQDCC